MLIFTFSAFLSLACHSDSGTDSCVLSSTEPKALFVTVPDKRLLTWYLLCEAGTFLLEAYIPDRPGIFGALDTCTVCLIRYLPALSSGWSAGKAGLIF